MCFGGLCGTCNENSECTDDSRNPADGSCVFTVKDCDDGDMCTSDWCDPVIGCGHDAIPACVPCGNYAEPCCAGDACNGSYTCNQGTCVFADCTGQDDFTLCKKNIAPDYSYDICVAGVCVSPGCGDATCNTTGPNFALPDTGQIKCYDNSVEMA